VSPDLLAESPELASVELLLHAVRIARAALVAANPELQDGDAPAALLESRSAQAYCADAIITHLDALDTTLGRYRDLVPTGPASPIATTF